MTYQKEIEVEFKYNGKSYSALADVTVAMSRQDVGPCGYHDHLERYVTDSVHVDNLSISDSESPDELLVIPNGLREKAESAVMELASEKAEEEMADE